MGDFNSVRKTIEKVGVNGGNVGAAEIRDFNNFISDMDIVEVPLISRSFTWYKPNERAKSRIDRILVSRDWSIFSLFNSCFKIQIRKFFHGMVNWRRKKNSLNGLFVDGRWMDDPKQVKLQAKEFFHNIFMEQHWERPLLKGVQFKQISDREKCQLTEAIGIEEIKMAVWDCGSSKSPGPDGFNFKFIKPFWETLKGDIVRMVKEFHANGKLPKGTNSTFITLIPKVDDPQSLDDYRPISLVGCLYKILAKILANRLKKVLPSIIDDRQSAFLEGRNLLQSVVIANETLYEVKKEKKSYIFFKVDYEKAYDSVNWEFLLYMLKRLGFEGKWIQWIQVCLESAHVSVLINGSPSKEFQMNRGLRQRDPLSPFLFTIVVEGLTGMMREACRKNLFSEVKVGEKNVEVSILQYVDDNFYGKSNNQKCHHYEEYGPGCPI
uniref:Transposon TX1 uncharacterized n=1 Tax=Cajanus cajan TaxID=3821 RepID=A0A151SM79_CAJCA|nr:Transposon TX1 uncharacterized [Cajanus cajan]